MLAPLGEHQRTTLVAAMRDVERLLMASLVSIVPIDPLHPDAVRCFEAYYRELDRRFDRGFDVGQSRTFEADEVRPPNGIVLIAHLDDRAIGCGSLKAGPTKPPEIKRLWVDPDRAGSRRGSPPSRSTRGACRGDRNPLGAARHERCLDGGDPLYRATGYVEVSRFNNETYADFWFEKRLTKRQVGYRG